MGLGEDLIRGQPRLEDGLCVLGVHKAYKLDGSRLPWEPIRARASFLRVTLECQEGTMVSRGNAVKLCEDEVWRFPVAQPNWSCTGGVGEGWCGLVVQHSFCHIHAAVKAPHLQL